MLAERKRVPAAQPTEPLREARGARAGRPLLGRIEFAGGGRVTRRPATRSAIEYVPWEEELLGGVLCTKDLDLVVIYEYDGTDLDGLIR